jgi:cell wall-active antibiotic response 4TMS protein YvqF
MTAARRGPIVAGTWLIGLGLVFIVRQAMGLDWGEAWPLFVILLGAAGLVTRAVAVDGVRGVSGVWSFTWPVVWIVVGVVLLASTTGNLAQAPLDVIAEWWPVLLVAVGAWFLVGAVMPFGGRPAEQLALPLGAAQVADIRIRFGAGQLTTGRARPGNLIDGSFAGGVLHTDLGPGRVELRQDTAFGLPWIDHDAIWAVGLAGDVPLDVRLDVGAARSSLDFSDLRLRTLELHTGASDTRVRLPAAAGATTVRAETGAASLVVEVPSGVAARIRTRIALGSSHIDESRFPRTSDGYASPDYATATNRVDIDISGGVGSFRVVGIG